MRYYKGRTNLAATVFVPVKCGNNCPFCNTNHLYDGFVFSSEVMDRILNQIEICNRNDSVTEFVVTGGEPLFDLNVLNTLVSRMSKPVYINTTLPLLKNIDECIDFINRSSKVEGVNISRHINLEHRVGTASLEYIDRIEKPVRINCLVDESVLGKELLDYIDLYAGPYRMVNLRADYRRITTDTLKNRDAVSQWLLENFKFEMSNNCLVCNSEFYSDERYKVICYHRGLENSSVTVGDRCYVNDVIIDINGNVFKDWDMVEDKDFNAALGSGILL